MTTPPTKPRSDRPSLDHFESALLTELRQHVAANPVHNTGPDPAPHHPRHHLRRRWAAGLAVAAAAATAFVVASPGGPATTPAYAIDQDADGDVVVRIHRLEDAEGLERALAEHGIDAVVSFDPDAGDDRFRVRIPDEAKRDASDPPPDGAVEPRRVEGGGPRLGTHGGQGPVTEATPIKPGERPDPAGCGTGVSDATGMPPVPPTLTHEDGDWVLRIPAGSPLHDRPVQITTGADGRLGVFYEGTVPDSYCGVMSVGAGG